MQMGCEEQHNKKLYNMLEYAGCRRVGIDNGPIVRNICFLPQEVAPVEPSHLPIYPNRCLYGFLPMHTYLLCQTLSLGFISEQYLQWEICLQCGIGCLLLRLVHQSIESIRSHMQTLSQRVECEGAEQLLHVCTAVSANVSHPLVCIESISLVRSSWAAKYQPVDHADRGRGIIFVSTSTNPASVMRVLSFDPIRRSFLSSRARRYCVLHLLKACSSVIEPLSD